MKPVKNLLFAALLVFSIAFNTLAGEVQVPGYMQPSPSPTPSLRFTVPEDPLTKDTLVTGTTIQETGVVTPEPSDYLFYEALVAFLSVY